MEDLNNLKVRTLRAGFAKVLATSANFIIRIGSLMVLARLLEPADFGLVGMVTAVTGVFSLFKDAGLAMVTIQRATITDEQISTLFWINILLGALQMIVTLALAPALAFFYDEPRLFGVASALAAGLLFDAAGVQHAALLQRQMRFISLATIELISSIVGIATGIGMAIGGFGYWALVGMAVVAPATYTACVIWTLNWVPGRPRRQVGCWSMIRFGGTSTLSILVNYVATNLEKVLLGRFWGAEALGIYGRAYQLVSIPTENINSAFGGVAFPLLSRLQHDPARFKSYFLNGYSLFLSLTFPIAVTCAVFADEIIFLFLGPKWKDAVVIFQLLTPMILALAFLRPFGPFLSSLGMLGRSLKLALARAPFMITAYILALPYGLRGVACATSAVTAMSVVPMITYCIRDTMISLQDIVRAVARPALSIIIGAALALGFQLLYGQSLSPISRLVLGGALLLFSYLFMLLYVMGQKSFYLDLIRVVWPRPFGGEKASVA